jgi:hypothetical protein
MITSLVFLVRMANRHDESAGVHQEEQTTAGSNLADKTCDQIK